MSKSSRQTHAQTESLTDEPPGADRSTPSSWRKWVWLSSGAALVGLMWTVCFLGRAPEGEILIGGFPLPPLLGIAGGIVYFVAIFVRPLGSPGRTVFTILAVAAGMRLAGFFAPALPGSDYCRYLWDGAVTASGTDPYRYSPQQVISGEAADPAIRELASSGRGVLSAVNHPSLRTIYPPVAQALFALAHVLTPFDLLGWRIVLLLFDVVCAAAVLSLLRRAGLPLVLWAVYLWNPLLVTETYHGGHVDLAAAAMVVIFAWALVGRHTFLAAVALALAVGVKLWPILLAFFLIGTIREDRRRLALALGVFAVLVALMAIPFVPAFGPSQNSGLIAYGRTWQGRSGAYTVFDRLAWWVRGRLNLSLDGRLIARALVTVMAAAVAAWLGVRRADDAGVLCRRVALVTLVMLLLSPALWPWYYLAVIPLAAIASPRLGLLLWTILLPMCYLEGNVLSGSSLSYVVHLPVWVVLSAQCAWPYVSKRLKPGVLHV